MEAGNEHVHVERKTTIGSLNEVALGHPFDFASREFLLFITPQVFNQGVAEDNIERVIGERQSGGIGLHPAHLVLQGRILWDSKIHDRQIRQHLCVRPEPPPPPYPPQNFGQNVTSTVDVQLVCAVGAKTGASHFSYWTKPDKLKSRRTRQLNF